MKSNLSTSTLARIASAIVITAFVAGCATTTSEKTQTENFADIIDLNCAQLKAEFAKLDKAAADNESENTGAGIAAKGGVVSGFQIPFLMYKHNEVSNRIADRRSRLTVLYSSKKCKA